MKFYNIENLKINSEILSAGVDLMLMSKAFKIVGKNEKFKTVDAAIVQDFVLFPKEYHLVDDNEVAFSHKSKSLNFALVAEKSPFRIVDTDGNQFYAAIYADKLYSNTDKEKLLELIENPTLDSSNTIEKKSFIGLIMKE